MTKHILLPLMAALCFLLADCNKLAKCKRYVGDYTDGGQSLSIKYDGVNFTLTKAQQVIPCTCTNQGSLILKDPAGAVAMLFSDTDGHKKICFEKDSAKQTCAVAM